MGEITIMGFAYTMGYEHTYYKYNISILQCLYLISNFHRTKLLQNVIMCTAFMLDDRPFIFVFCVNVSCLKMSWAKNRGSNDIERPKDNKRKSFLCHLFCTTLQLLFTQVTARLTSIYHLRFFQKLPHQTLKPYYFMNL